MDVVLMRQDLPLFDMAYITATHLLEAIHPKTLVVNKSGGGGATPRRKLFVTPIPGGAAADPDLLQDRRGHRSTPAAATGHDP